MIDAYAGDDDIAKADVDELQGELRDSKARAARTRDELDSAGSSLRRFCTRAEYAALAGVADGAVLAEVDVLAPRADVLLQRQWHWAFRPLYRLSTCTNFCSPSRVQLERSPCLSARRVIW